MSQELWPGESISCPWGKDDRNVEGGQDRANEETLAEEHDPNEEPFDSMVPSVILGITNALETFQLDRVTPLLLKPQESTVSGVDFGHICRWLSQCEEDTSHSECKASPIQWQNLPET